MRLLKKLFSKDGPALIRRRLILAQMKLRKVTPLTVKPIEAEAFFAFGPREQNNRLVKALSDVPCNCFFDIGANCGFFSREFLRERPGYSGRLVLFEPLPNLMSIAVKSLSGFSAPEKVFVNAALGDSTGQIRMYLPPTVNMGWITASRTTEEQSTYLDARVSPAADYVSCYKPEIIKIDVEGFEATVFKSIIPCITDDYKPVFLSEIEFAGNWPKMQECIAVMKQKGYKLFDPDGKPILDSDLRQGLPTIDAIIRVPSTSDRL